jgi:hypothetical protein
MHLHATGSTQRRAGTRATERDHLEASVLKRPGCLDCGQGLGEADQDHRPARVRGRAAAPVYRHRFTTDLPSCTAVERVFSRGDRARRSMSAGVSVARTE